MDAANRLGGSELRELNDLTSQIIGAAIEVHRSLGPGLMERLYEKALAIELTDRRIAYRRQVRIPAEYKGHRLGNFFADFVVDHRIIVEVKSVTIVLPIFRAQLITYMRLTGARIGLIMNFKAPLMKEGIVRLIL